jgi:hypothetical protein
MFIAALFTTQDSTWMSINWWIDKEDVAYAADPLYLQVGGFEETVI